MICVSADVRGTAMDIIDELLVEAEKCGFSHYGKLDADTIEVYQAARDACAENKCKRYGTNWSCPPGCGTLDECLKKIRRYKRGVIVQTTGDIDQFNYESYTRLGKEHNERFAGFARLVKDRVPGALLCGANACSGCEKCTYPDAPCRFPETLSYPMEGMGMMVFEVCRRNGLKYNYGPGTLTYISCVLVD